MHYGRLDHSPGFLRVLVLSALRRTTSCLEDVLYDLMEHRARNDWFATSKASLSRNTSTRQYQLCVTCEDRDFELPLVVPLSGAQHSVFFIPSFKQVCKMAAKLGHQCQNLPNRPVLHQWLSKDQPSPAEHSRVQPAEPQTQPNSLEHS